MEASGHAPSTQREPSSSPMSSVSESNLPTSPLRQATIAEDAEPSSPSLRRRTKRVTPIVTKSKPPARKSVVKKKKWNAENILTDPKSPLASADLRRILSHPMAWEVLSEKEQEEIIALFPDRRHIIEDEQNRPHPNFESLRNDDSFRFACASYTENIVQGRHDPEWLSSAWTAHERRKAGDYDDYLMNKFEQDWDVQLPDELKQRRKLPDEEGAK